MSSGLSYARRVLNQEDRPLNAIHAARELVREGKKLVKDVNISLHSPISAEVLQSLNSQTYKELPKPKEKKVHNKKKKSIRGDLYYKQSSECFYCWQVVQLKEFTLDHVVPRSSGGLLSRENTVGACIECNEAKGSLSRDEFEASAWLLKKRFPT